MSRYKECLIALLLLHAKAANIILLGDSYAELADDSLLDVCRRVDAFANRGVSGSTAAEWADGACEWAWGADRRRTLGGRRLDACSAEDAFADGVAYSRAWVSIGGNDALQSGCAPPDVTTLARALTEIKDAAPPGLRVLATGYGSVAATTEEGCGPPDVAAINAAIREATVGLDFVDFVDVLGAFGGSATAFSSWNFYDDAIHLNDRGYERLFTLPAVQAFFECDGAVTAEPTTATPTDAPPTTTPADTPTTGSPMDAPTTATPTDAPSRTVLPPTAEPSVRKILCLHGGGGSAAGFRKQPGMRDLMASLDDDEYEFVFASSPYRSGPYGGLWMRFPPDGKPTPDGKGEPTTDPNWAEAAIASLDQVVADDGPFYAILGYSQGAAFIPVYLANTESTFDKAMLYCGHAGPASTRSASVVTAMRP